MILENEQPATDAPLGRAPTPQPAQEEGDRPGFFQAAGAALSTGTTAELGRSIAGEPFEPAEPEPGYNFLEHIPAGYLHDYGHEYVETTNSSQAQAITDRIDRKRAAEGVIARAGWKGVAASLASGFVDPLNIAAMAIFPEAAPTRAGNALRWAFTNAAVAGGEEAIGQAAGEPTTAGQAAFNIGAGALLGGVLGPLAHRVPKAEFEKMTADLGEELHGAAREEPSKVMGSAQRSVVDELDSHVAGLEEAGFKDGYIPPVEEERAAPIYVPPLPEGPTRPRPGFTPEIEPHRMSLTEAIAVTKGETAGTHGLSYNEAIAQGLDPADLEAARFGSRRVFTKGGASFDEMAEALHQHGYPVADEAGNYSPNALLDSLDMELRGKKQYSGAADDYLTRVLEHERASEAADRGVTPKEQDLEKEAQIQAAKEAEKEALKAEIPEEAEHALPGEPMYVNPEMESTAGAMAVHGGQLADMEVARGGKLYSKSVGRVSVGARLMESESPSVRRLTMELMNLPGTLEGHYRDKASPNPIERILWQEVDAKQTSAISKMNEQFGQYKKRMRAEGGPALDRTAFEEQWARAMRRGDKSEIPEVSEMARWQRENILKPYWERAKAAGMAPDEANLFADSYLTRLYDIPKIRANKAAWLDLLRTSFMKQGVEDPSEARMIAHDVDRNISSGERNTMDWHATDGIVPKSGRLKERKLMLADSTLEPFLSSNHSELTRAYLHSIVPEVNMVERFGTRDLSDQFQQIRDEYAHMIELANKDPARIRELEKARDSQLGLLSAARDQLYGIYGVPRDPANFFIRAGRFLRALNIGRMLGGATFKHFPDAANVIQRYGAPQTMAVMAKLATSLDAIKMGYAEAKRMGAAIDMVSNLSASRLWDAPAHSTFPEQRFLNKFNRVFTIATLETPLITATQSIASVAGQDEILRMAQRVAAGRMLPKNRAAVLASAGLDTGMLQRIADANSQHGREINGLKFGMSEQWADKQAAQAFESAVIRDAHGVTMRPGIGDKPLFMSKEWGKFVFQFKSFEFAASRIVGLPMLQGLAHGDARAAQALLAQFALATMGYVAYQKATGGTVETDPKKLIVELMDRTNLTGWTGSVIFPALYALGFKDLTRWYDKDPVSSVGPSAEMVKEIMDRRLPGRLLQSVTGNTDGQEPLAFRRSDLHFMRKVAPANQVWYARRAVDKLEDSIGDAFNLPGESLEERANSRVAQGVGIE